MRCARIPLVRCVLGRIERYLRAIRDAPARPLVLLNKADLSPLSSLHAERLRSELRGVPVLLASAEHGAGLAELSSEEQARKFERELAWQRDRHDPLRAREALSARRARARSLRADQKQRRGP
jgi:ribosome biogenesis GTPase A